CPGGRTGVSQGARGQRGAVCLLRIAGGSALGTQLAVSRARGGGEPWLLRGRGGRRERRWLRGCDRRRFPGSCAAFSRRTAGQGMRPPVLRRPGGSLPGTLLAGRGKPAGDAVRIFRERRR